MAPPLTIKRQGLAAAQTNSRQGRNARSRETEDVDEDLHADEPADVAAEAEVDDIEPSQGTAVQNMIIGGFNNVWQSTLIHKHRWDFLTNATAAQAVHGEQEASEGAVQP